MKLVVILALVGFALGNPTSETKNYNQKCTTECNISTEMKNRLKAFEFHTTDDDKCFILCVAKTFHTMDADGKFKIEGIKTLFTTNGAGSPVEMELITDMTQNDEKFMDNITSWLHKNKQGFATLRDNFIKKHTPPTTAE